MAEGILARVQAPALRARRVLAISFAEPGRKKVVVT